MIGRSLSAGSSTLFVRGNRDKEFEFGDRNRRIKGERAEQNLGQKITGAFQPGSTEHRSPVKERNLQSKPVKS